MKIEKRTDGYLLKEINNYNEIEEFINKNNCKKIFLDLNLNKDYDFLDKLSNYTNIDFNIICLDDKDVLSNMATYTIEEFQYCRKKIKEVIEPIKNIKPIFQLLYIYDYAKSFEYEEAPDENLQLSRFVPNILLTKKIICQGYARLINVLINELNNPNLKSISESVAVGKTNTENHIANLVYINDEKVDGLFSLDATWDSKRTGIQDLESYLFFLVSIKDYDNTYGYKRKKGEFSKYLLNKDLDLQTIPSWILLRISIQFCYLLNQKNLVLDYFNESDDIISNDKEFRDKSIPVINDLIIKINELATHDIDLEQFTNILKEYKKEDVSKIIEYNKKQSLKLHLINRFIRDEYEFDI